MKKKMIIYLILLNLPLLYCEKWHKFGKFEVMYSPDGLYMYDYTGSERITELKEKLTESDFFPAFYAGDDFESFDVSQGKKLNKTFILSIKLGDNILKYDLTPIKSQRASRLS